MVDEVMFKGSLDNHKADKATWSKYLGAVTRTSKAFRNAVYEASLSAISHFMDHGDVIRLNDINARLQGVDAAAVRRWVSGAIGQMVEFSTKDEQWKVRKGWAEFKATLDVSVLEINPLDFAKVKDDPADYTVEMFLKRLEKLVGVTEGKVGNHNLPEDQAVILEAIKPAIVAAVAQAKAIRQSFLEADAEQANEPTIAEPESNITEFDSAAA